MKTSGNAMTGRAFRRPPLSLLGVTALGWLLLSVPAPANDEPEAIAAEPVLLEGSAPISSDALDDERARANIEIHHVTINDQELNGVVSGNTAINNTTGDNIVADGAFVNAAGFISTVQNSGNNVLIQNSTIINVAVEP